jgi:hypothetical protein
VRLDITQTRTAKRNRSIIFTFIHCVVRFTN